MKQHMSTQFRVATSATLRITGSTVQYPWYHLKSRKEGGERKLGQRLGEDMRKEVCMVVSRTIPHVIYIYSDC